MNTHLHPAVLEARFDQLAIALLQGGTASGPAIDTVGEQARRALQGVDEIAHTSEHDRLGRAAARLARRLLARRRGPTDIEQGILRLGIERGRQLEPLNVAATLRGVRCGGSPLLIAGSSSDEPAAKREALFTLIALVALLARGHAP